MIFKDILNLVNEDKRKKERAKVAQNFALGIGFVGALGVATGMLTAPKSGKETREDMKGKVANTIKTIKDNVQKNVDMIKDSTSDVEHKVCNEIKDIKEKTENVKNDIKDGYHEVEKDINKITENISKELSKSVK